MSYGNTSTSKLICDCCGYVGKDSIPGLYYMDMFYTDKCRCGGEILLCSGCSGTRKASKIECKACIRDRKIDKVIGDGKN